MVIIVRLLTGGMAADTVAGVPNALLLMLTGDLVLTVAGKTGVASQAFRMAGLAVAVGTFMIPGKRVGSVVRRRQPAIGRVALRALGTELARMDGRLAMAGRAVLWRTLISAVAVAPLT